MTTKEADNQTSKPRQLLPPELYILLASAKRCP
jgi:hypothetical protein